MKRTLDIKPRFAILPACFALGLLSYGAWSLKVLRELRVNGPLYEHIVQSKDLVADILPPPEYIIESDSPPTSCSRLATSPPSRLQWTSCMHITRATVAPSIR